MVDRRTFLIGGAGALSVATALPARGADERAAEPFVTVRVYSAPAENVAELMSRIRDSFVPIVSAMPGFIAYYGVDAGATDGQATLVFVNVFETREQADASTAAATAWIPDHIAGLGMVRTATLDGAASVTGHATGTEVPTRYVTVRQYTTPPGNAAEVLRRARESFLPIVRVLPGFVAYYGLDAGDGTLLFVNVFTRQSGAEASTAVAVAWTPDHVAELEVVRVATFDGAVKVLAGDDA